jgi:hypothetical protein
MALTGYYRRNVLDKFTDEGNLYIDSYSYKKYLGAIKYVREIQSICNGRQSFRIPRFGESQQLVLSIWI